MRSVEWPSSGNEQDEESDEDNCLEAVGGGDCAEPDAKSLPVGVHVHVCELEACPK
jgi:hypothetical protein